MQIKIKMKYVWGTAISLHQFIMQESNMAQCVHRRCVAYVKIRTTVDFH